MPDYLAPFLASFAYAASKKPSLRILDFGGASGYFRAHVKSFYSYTSTDWTVIETAAQVELNKDLGLPDVRYSTDINSETYDLAIFSGSLQFVPDWRKPLSNAQADLVYIARTPLGTKDQAFVQRITKDRGVFRYPGQVISETSLRSFLERDYTLRALWKFDAHLFELGVHAAPAMLWERNYPL